MTEASVRALEGLRDWTTLKWYVIPLLAIVIFVYVMEIRKAREGGNWDPVFAGLTLFGVDFLNETINGLILHFTGHSALWTAPGETALRTMVGWNIEIMFMFALSGIIFYYTLSPSGKQKILGLPEKWFWAVGYAAFCVVVEVFLNKGGHLVWEYPFWYRSFGGIWLIFLFGYFHFYAAIIGILAIKSYKTRALILAGLYGGTLLANIIFTRVLGWIY
jgi:hypothetical protein